MRKSLETKTKLFKSHSLILLLTWTKTLRSSRNVTITLKSLKKKTGRKMKRLCEKQNNLKSLKRNLKEFYSKK